MLKKYGITKSREIFFFFFSYLALTATLHRDLNDRGRTDKPLISGLVQRYTEQDHAAATYEAVSA